MLSATNHLSETGAARPPILVNRNHKKPQTESGVSSKYALAVRCSCKSVWCKGCYRKTSAKKQSARMQLMDWRRVRNVTLTLDPSNWEDGEAAYVWYKLDKPIGRFIQNLDRAGIKVTDWTCNLEWHENGFPHWHLLIEVATPGQAGMIGQDLIHSLWAWGDRVHRVYEKPFRTERQFKRFTGYFAKTGYLHKDKQHQMELPGWASGKGWEGIKINRFSSMRRPGRNKSASKAVLEPIKRQHRQMTYAAKHAGCGQKVEIWEADIFEDNDGDQRCSRKKIDTFNIPYDKVVNFFAGEFYSGYGFSFECSTGFVCSVLKAWEKSPPKPPDKSVKYRPALPGYMINCVRNRHYEAVFGPF